MKNTHTSRAFAVNQCKNIELKRDLQKHHFARMAMMMADERGEDLSYEEALKL